MIIQFCGLSGSGKTTLANNVKDLLQRSGLRVEVIDGDVYRMSLSPELGFSRGDRNINVRRLAFVASRLASHNILSIICAINPYEDIRREIKANYPDVQTVFIKCSLEALVERDTKGLYKKALLPCDHPDRVENLTGVNDPFEVPEKPDLIIDTEQESIERSTDKLYEFIMANIT